MSSDMIFNIGANMLMFVHLTWQLHIPNKIMGCCSSCYKLLWHIIRIPSSMHVWFISVALHLVIGTMYQCYLAAWVKELQPKINSIRGQLDLGILMPTIGNPNYNIRVCKMLRDYVKKLQILNIYIKSTKGDKDFINYCN